MSTVEQDQEIARIAFRIFFGRWSWDPDRIQHDPPSTCQRDVDARVGDFVAALASRGVKVIARGAVRWVTPGDSDYLEGFGDQIKLSSEWAYEFPDGFGVSNEFDVGHPFAAR